jgi:hypothetical protein
MGRKNSRKSNLDLPAGKRAAKPINIIRPKLESLLRSRE